MLLPSRHFFRLYVSAVVFLLIILSGMAGFMLIEHYTALEAAYMTIITLSTVGFAEIRPLSDSGRLFTIFLIIANIGTFAYVISQLSTFFLDGEFIQTYKLFKMKNSIKALEGHIIICGFGRNGREAAKIFHNSGRPFVVVEKAGARIDDLPFPIDYYLEDDATRDETLLEAGIMKAGTLLTTLPDDAANLFVVLTARELNPGLKIISRASNDSSVKKIRTAGAANVVMPDKIGGAHMATLVLSPDISEFVDLMATQSNVNFNIVEIKSSVTTTLKELDCWHKTGATVLGIKTADGEYILNPPAPNVIRTSDCLIIMGTEEQLKSATRLLTV